jgi:thiamine biosynthesis lipoprotein ApbE
MAEKIRLSLANRRSDPAFGQEEYLGIWCAAGNDGVTSGISNALREKGVRYHNILDTRTGNPADRGLVSVKIIGTSASTAARSRPRF